MCWHEDADASAFAAFITLTYWQSLALWSLGGRAGIGTGNNADETLVLSSWNP